MSPILYKAWIKCICEAEKKAVIGWCDAWMEAGICKGYRTIISDACKVLRKMRFAYQPVRLKVTLFSEAMKALMRECVMQPLPLLRENSTSLICCFKEFCSIFRMKIRLVVVHI